MSVSTAVDPSTRPLSEVARHLVIPSGIVDTLWFDVEERCREFGDSFDAWQDGLGQLALGLRADGMFAATIGGVSFSIPRQVAKTFIVMRIVVAICTLFPNVTVVWTAHRTRTATNTFQKMKALVLRPAARRYLRPGSNQGTAIRDANGEQEIPFINGSRILFGAREQGFGRGFDEVDIEVFDEAQILTEKALDDIVPAANQSRFPHGALVFFMGTPPRPTDPGEVFTARRTKALSGATTDALYVECSADPGADPEDREQWARANPSYPVHTPEESMLRMRELLGDDESFMREGLGIWDEFKATDRILPAADWDLCLRPDAARRDEIAYAVAVGEDSRAATIAASDGAVVRVIEWDRGSKWLPEKLAEVLAERPAPVWLFDKGPTGSLLTELAEEGIEWETVKGTEYAQACGAFHYAVTEAHSISHAGQATLDIAVAQCERRKHADAWVWDRRKSSVDISPLEAVTIARWAALQQTDQGGVNLW